MNDNNSDSVRSIDSDESRTVSGGDVFEDGSAVICPDCGGDLDYLSREYVKCTDCEADYSHYWQFAGVGKRHELRDSHGEQVAVYDERQIDDDPELVTDGGESQQTTEQCGMYDCPTREGPVVKTRTLSAARSTTPVEMLMCQSCIDDGWAMEVLD